MQVLGHVLPVLGQLQRGADGIGQLGPRRGEAAEDVEHDPAHRVGRQAAVAEQVLEGLVTGNGLVLPVGLDQVEEGLHRDPAVGHGGPQRAHHAAPGLCAITALARVVRAVAAGVQAAEVGLKLVKQPEPLVRRSLIPDVVRRPGEAVHRHQVPPTAGGQHPQRDREVLARGPPGPRINRIDGSPGRRGGFLFQAELTAHRCAVACHDLYLGTGLI